MGRMADARRRARQAADAPPSSAPAPDAPLPPPVAASEAPAVPPATPPEVARAASDELPEDAAQAALEPAPAADDFVFADEPRAPPARIVLPSSGLAEDILRAAEGEAGGRAEDMSQATADAPPVESEAAAARAHQFTFFAAPEREARELPEATEHLVTFVIGHEEYGVDVRLVQEIIRVPAVTPVPRAPAFAKGVINLRGRIIPVMDFKAKLGLGQADATQRKARILVVRLKGRLIGLLVDGASQVLKVPVSSIEAAPEEVVETDAGHIRGVAKLRDRLVILVDLQRVLAGELRAAGAAE